MNEGASMTYNPLTVMLINMTVVFGVLISLGVLMELTRLIDPTKKKSEVTPQPAAAPAAAVAVAAPAAAAADETLAIIAAAIAAMGYSASQIVAVRPVGAETWGQSARVEVVQTRNQMF